MAEFIYKNETELKALTEEERNKYLSDKHTFEDNRIKEVGIELKKQDEAMKEMSLKLREFEEMAGTQPTETVKEAVFNFLTENKDKLKQLVSQRSEKVEVKAPALVTTANGTLTTALPTNFVAETQGVKPIKIRKPLLLDFVNATNTNQTTLAYVEAMPKEGDFAVVAEGGTKPQLDINWVTSYATPEKYAGYIKITEEALEDIPQLTDLIVNYLKAKHDVFKEKRVYAYINTNATAYVVGGALANTQTNANIVDVVNAMQSQILATPNYTDEMDYFGDTVLMNTVDFFARIVMAKDNEGRPLFPNLVFSNGTVTLGGITFIASSVVTAGSIFLIDSNKVNVTTYKEGYRTSVGWVNDDFIKNLLVILGESRGHIYVENQNKRALVKGTIATIISDLNA